MCQQVGDTILDPFGKDPEDFAVLHFVECTAASSLEVIEVEHAGRHVAERPTFYTVEELNAAHQLVRGMIRRFRARKAAEKPSVTKAAEDLTATQSAEQPTEALGAGGSSGG